MAEKNAHHSLEEIISLGERGVIDSDHMGRWIQFKKGWAEADAEIWNDLKKRMKVDDSGTMRLIPPLSSSEKEWAKNFIRRAEERGLC